ncbi:MAG TPA: sugar transferase, partial [Gemmataceae bacterium]|nr:sugar transferase [Gemmataceae bacterium]
MLFTRVVHGVRKLAGRWSEDGLQWLHPAVELRRILERERARADRTGDNLSLLTLVPPHAEEASATWTFLAKVLKARLRTTDEAGWLDSNCRIGVVLPNTAGPGAWKLADDVCHEYVGGLAPPVCTVYSYPSSRRINGVERSPDQVDSPRPALELEAFFVHRMPAWKRLLDVAGALVGLFALLPVLAIIAIAVKLSSPGPVLFRQQRSGRGGQP